MQKAEMEETVEVSSNRGLRQVRKDCLLLGVLLTGKARQAGQKGPVWEARTPRTQEGLKGRRLHS